MPFNIPKVVTVMNNGITSNFQLFPSPVQNNRNINLGLDYDTVTVFSIESFKVLKKRLGRHNLKSAFYMYNAICYILYKWVLLLFTLKVC